jgi:hypothetical protein
MATPVAARRAPQSARLEVKADVRAQGLEDRQCPLCIRIAPQRLFHFLAVGGYQVKKLRDLSIEEIDVCGESAPSRGVSGYGAGADGPSPHVADKPRRVDGFPFGVEQVLGADQDEGLRLNSAQRSGIITVEPGCRADVVLLVSPRLVDSHRTL